MLNNLALGTKGTKVNLAAKEFILQLFYPRYTAKILEIDASDNTIEVHFDGWNSRYDEWFTMSSENLRCIARHSERKETRSKTVNKSVSV